MNNNFEMAKNENETKKDELKYKIPDWIKKYVVKDVKTVDELLNKYSKTYNTRTQEYHDAMLKSHIRDLEKYGYDFVNHHDSITGNHVAILKK